MKLFMTEAREFLMFSMSDIKTFVRRLVFDFVVIQLHLMLRLKGVQMFLSSCVLDSFLEMIGMHVYNLCQEILLFY